MSALADELNAAAAKLTAQAAENQALKQQMLGMVPAGTTSLDTEDTAAAAALQTTLDSLAVTAPTTP